MKVNVKGKYQHNLETIKFTSGVVTVIEPILSFRLLWTVLRNFSRCYLFVSIWWLNSTPWLFMGKCSVKNCNLLDFGGVYVTLSPRTLHQVSKNESCSYCSKGIQPIFDINSALNLRLGPTLQRTTCFPYQSDEPPLLSCHKRRADHFITESPNVLRPTSSNKSV